MAGGLIGSLRVALGLDSAQFQSGIAGARKELGSFERQVTAAAKGALAGFAGALSIGSIEQFASAVGRATGEVAELYRQAKISGTAFKDFQTLGQVFQQNGVAVADFGNALREMQDKASEFVTTGGGRAADALKVLGYDAASAGEALKNPAEMLRSIIDRLGDVPSQAQRIQMMGDIFGNAGGDKFLRVVDLGRQGIQKLEAQIVQSGTVISDSMGARATELDMKFTALQAKWDNWWKGTLVGIADAVDRVGTGTGQRPTARPGTTAFYDQQNLINSTDPIGSGGSLSELQNWMGPDTSGLGVKPTSFDFRQFLDPKGGLAGGIASIGTAAQSAQQYIDPFFARMQELSPVLDQTHNPFATMNADLTDLRTMMEAMPSRAAVFQQAMVRTYANVAAAAFDMAGGITGALASMFKDNKQFAVANAVVQTLSGVANAIGTGPFPLNFINAGLVAATGAANVANILSTNDHSTSVPGSGSGGAAPAAAAAAAPRQAVNISLQGASLFSTEMVEQLLNQMADAMGDGAGSRLINVVRA